MPTSVPCRARYVMGIKLTLRDISWWLGFIVLILIWGGYAIGFYSILVPSLFTLPFVLFMAWVLGRRNESWHRIDLVTYLRERLSSLRSIG